MSPGGTDPAMGEAPPAGRPPELPAELILYDGVCGFCDRAVQWILDADREGRFRFAALQGETAAAVLGRHPELPRDVDTIVYVRRTEAGGEEVFVRSTAALHIAMRLGGAWRLFAPGWLLPRPLRDLAYAAFAALRYRLFGKLDQCRIPAPEERARFLD